MISRLAICGLVIVLAQQAVAQDCKHQADCRNDIAICEHTNYKNQPSFWPPCPHGGSCVCPDGYALWSNNGSCIPYVTLGLNDPCSNRPWERVSDESLRCNGRQVICNTPTYREVNGFCELVPQPTFTTRQPFTTAGRTCNSVGFLEFCDNDNCCISNLQCARKGRNATYSQCRCSDDSLIWDDGIGACRARVYGDNCLVDSDCNSDLIANTGYECRWGRCRCQSGYEPYDVTYFNGTDIDAPSTYTWRICIIETATTWVPTGQECTMNPEKSAGLDTTRACHPRSFCHRCITEGAGTSGVCREFTCGGEGNCGSNSVCNNGGASMDPACENAICDCDWNKGYYKDRFSRCAPYQKLRLGDRCIIPDGSSQLLPMYVNNEAWDEDKECVAINGATNGYAGYNWGVLKCKLPLVEDADGNCVRNDDGQWQWYQALNYGDYCDDTDNRLPLKRCGGYSNAGGLSCIANKCSCPTTATCSAAYGRCGVTSSGNKRVEWDGSTCRTTGQFGDACTTNSDCCGGDCNNGFCGCSANYVALTYTSALTMNNGDGRVQFAMSTATTCFKNATVVGKGEECNLEPTTWDCKSSYVYGNSVRKLYKNAQVCATGLVCKRCPSDFGPEDEAFGICRSISATPDAAPGPDSCSGNGGNGNNWGNWAPWTPWGPWSNSAMTTISSSIVVFFLAAFAAL